MLLKKLDFAIREFFCLFLVRVDELLMFFDGLLPFRYSIFFRFKANPLLMGMVHPKTRFNSN